MSKTTSGLVLALTAACAVVYFAIWIILATARGERRMRPDFGCGINDLVFESNNAATAPPADKQKTAEADNFQGPRVVPGAFFGTTTHVNSEGMIRLLADLGIRNVRVDVPWVDKSVAEGGDPLDVGLGDVKGRIGLHAVRAGSGRLSPFLDLVFPTAGSAALGSGKWQLGPGATLSVPLPAPWSGPTRAARFVPKLEQYVSIGGDPDRKDVSYTQAELKLEVEWRRGLMLSVNPKPVVDWTAGFDTAAVLEVQGTWIVSPAWRLWAKGGARLWGPTLPATYDRQLELAVRLTL